MGAYSVGPEVKVMLGVLVQFTRSWNPGIPPLELVWSNVITYVKFEAGPPETMRRKGTYSRSFQPSTGPPNQVGSPNDWPWNNCSKSSLRIVPTPWPSPMVALVGFERLTKKVSLNSAWLSPVTATVIVWLVVPGGNV